MAVADTLHAGHPTSSQPPGRRPWRGASPAGQRHAAAAGRDIGRFSRRARGRGRARSIGPNGKVPGTPDPENALATIRAAGLLSTPPLILPRPHSITLDDKTVCITRKYLPACRMPTASTAATYRTRAQNRLLSSAELTGLLLARDEAGFESRPAAERPWPTSIWPR